MRIKLQCLLISLCLYSVTHSQQLFHQDIFHGGVTAAGWSSGVGAGVGTGTIEIHIEPGSTIRNAWLFMYSQGNPPENHFNLNNIPIKHNELIFLNQVTHTLDQVNPVKYFYHDISHIITTDNNEYSIELFINSTGPELNWGWYCPIIYVEYEHPDLPKLTSSLWINDQNHTGLENYTFSALNPINTTNPVGLALFMDRACNPLGGRSTPKLNNVTFNPIGGSNLNSLGACAGVRGHFYYQNNILFGLDAAVANNQLGDQDALLDAASFLPNNTTSYNLEIRHTSYPNIGPGRPSLRTIYPIAYTTPCDTFSTNITPDTTVCKGTNLALNASGGTNYEWLDAGVSDPFSPSITVSADSSRIYVVRIEDSPGCYKTASVHVNVKSVPKINQINIQPSICGEDNGSIQIVAEGEEPFTYSLDTLVQNSANFTNLAGGEYLVGVTDQKGCTTTQLVTVADNIIVQAEFVAIPPEGSKPLSVTFLNASANATDYEWFIDDEFNDNSINSNGYFQENGTYTVTLIAYNKQPHCADTFSLNIFVRDTITAIIPNVFTPNNDGVNDLFTLEVKGAQSLTAYILNRWGNEIHRYSTPLDAENLTKTTLWNGTAPSGEPATEGVYFYKIEFVNLENETEIYSGFFHLNR